MTGQIFSLIKATHTLESKINDLESNEFRWPRTDIRMSLGLETLKRDLEMEHTRRQVIEEKAKTNVFGITIVTAIFAGIILIAFNILDSNSLSALWAMPLVFLCIAMMYLLTGGLVALSALRMRQVQLWTAYEETEKRDDKKAALIAYMEYNLLVNLIKSNKVDTSYVQIRNGIIVLAFAIILSVTLTICHVLDGLVSNLLHLSFKSISNLGVF